MGIARASWRLLSAAGHVLRGMAIVAREFDALDDAGRQRHIQRWSRQLFALLGIEVVVRGQPAAQVRGLLIANHVSWIDIAGLHTACPQARFVSKADVLRWPLLGWLIRNVGTLFIERERKRDAVRVVHEMAASLQRGETVAIFPEGTTSTGEDVLPFHANLLQAAIATHVPVHPAVLRYGDARHRYSPEVAYVGDTTLVASIWRIAMAEGVTLYIDLLPAVDPTGTDRRALGQALRERLRTRLHEPETASAT